MSAFSIFPDIHNNSIALFGERELPTLLTFYRFSSCPFCNLRVRVMRRWYQSHMEMTNVIGIFGSPAKEVKKVEELHNPGFPLISDEKGILYRAYGVKKSWFGVIKAIVTRFPTLLKGIHLTKKNPLITHRMLNTMPATFLLDKDGKILFSYFGKDEGDHVPLEVIEKQLQQL